KNKNNSCSIKIRCAAVEALASLDSVSDAELVELYECFCEKEESQGKAKIFNPGTPELVIELLHSLAQRVNPTELQCFTSAISSRDPSVRLAVVKIWRDAKIPPARTGNSYDSSTATCPDVIAKLVFDPGDERVRAAAISTLAHWKYPQFSRYAKDGLRDSRLSVRLATIDAIGVAGEKELVSLLRENVKDQSPKVRTHIAASFRKMNEKDEVFQLVGDKSLDVRVEVAKALDDVTYAQSFSLAEKLLKDQSPQVQKAVICSIEKWPIEYAAPILLEEMGSQSLQKRETATVALTKMWPDARDFEFSNRQVAERQASLEELKDRFYSIEDFQALRKNNNNDIKQVSHSAATQRELDRSSLEKGRTAFDTYCDLEIDRRFRTKAEDSLLELGPKLPLVIEYLSINENKIVPEEIYTELLPRVDRIFVLLNDLQSDSVNERRTAANEILSESQRTGLSPLHMTRLFECGVRENDALTLLTIMQIFDTEPGELADNFAVFQLDNNATQVRRRACELLQKSGDVAVIEYLTPLLYDRSPDIVHYALLAIGELAERKMNSEIDEQRNSGSGTGAYSDTAGKNNEKIHEAVNQLLLRNESVIQVTAAITLCKLHDQRGTAALERLANSKDNTTRLLVAQSMKQLSDPALARILVGLLDDNGSIRSAALNSLPILVGTDHGNPSGQDSISLPTRIKNWKNWESAGVRRQGQTSEVRR
ncbi:MAG: HEAT repeat domain-containing protein, partial [Thermoguttaceae bacterium]